MHNVCGYESGALAANVAKYCVMDSVSCGQSYVRAFDSESGLLVGTLGISPHSVATWATGAYGYAKLCSEMEANGMYLGSSLGVPSFQIPGGLVAPVMFGLHRQGATDLDFSSHYPTSIVGANPLYETTTSAYEISPKPVRSVEWTGLLYLSNARKTAMKAALDHPTHVDCVRAVWAIFSEDWPYMKCTSADGCLALPALARSVGSNVKHIQPVAQTEIGSGILFATLCGWTHDGVSISVLALRLLVGVVASMIGRSIASRDAIKLRVKGRAPTSAENAEMQALKLSMNSVYGIFGDPNKDSFDPALAGMTTVLCRAHERALIEACEHLGFVVLAADTDSAIVSGILTPDEISAVKVEYRKRAYVTTAEFGRLGHKNIDCVLMGKSRKCRATYNSAAGYKHVGLACVRVDARRSSPTRLGICATTA